MSPAARAGSRRLLASSLVAPVTLIGGWRVAEHFQPAEYRPRRDTISALAGSHANRPGLMGGAFVAVGCSYLATAASIPTPRTRGRVALALGGIGMLGVAAFPLRDDRSAPGHAAAAALALGALALWPVLASGPDAPVWPLRPVPARAVSLVSSALLGWFVSELGGGERCGLAERAAAGTEALYPAVVAFALARAERQGLRS